MKLISCHIENYGSLSRFDYKFDGGFNQFYSSNGKGKSTLASFIKAMFYGLPTDTSRSKFNERRHFYPFSGGNFGGSLTFFWQGNTYRIERLFTRSGTTGDELRIYENNSPCGKGSPFFVQGREPGEVVFGLDEQSFVRTLFFNAERSELSSTGGINAKLNDYLALTDGETSFERALADLDKAAKKLKMRGGKGRIAELEEQVRTLRSEIDARQKVCAALEGKYAQLNSLKAQIAALEAQEGENNKRAEIKQKWAHYDDLVAAAERCGRRIAQIEGAYPAGMPTEKDAAELNAAVLKEAELNAKIASGNLSESETAKLSELENFFGGDAPSEEKLDCMSEKARTLTAERAYIQAAETQGDSHYEKLRSQFSSGEPSEEQLGECAEEVEKYKKLCSAPARSGGMRTSLTALILALACAACGVALFALKNTAFGIVMLCVAAAILVATVATRIYVRKRSAEQPDAGAIEENIKNILAPYNVELSQGVAYAYARLCEDLKEYRALKQKYAARESELSERKERVRSLGEELEKFLSPYALVGDAETQIAEIRSRAEEYASLKVKRSSARAAVAALRGELDVLESSAGGILTRYNLGGRSYANASSKIRADISERERLLSDLSAAKKSAENFASANALTSRPAEDGGQSVATELASLRSRVAVISNDISSDEALTETLGEKQNALNNAQEELEECREKFKTYVAAAEFLSLAEHSLNEKYVAPIKDRFADYAEELKSVLGGEIYMDRNFAITYEEGGATRTDEHLSSGQRAVVAFCFRLALADNIFGDDQPFIVMDDPFSDLDEEHLKRAAKLVEKLALGRQIIYFCCHESRKMK